MYLFCKQEKEKELAINNMHIEVRQKLQEKEEEVRLALEERELQKMAAVSGLDEQKDELLRRIEDLNSVCHMLWSSYLVASLCTVLDH